MCYTINRKERGDILKLDDKVLVNSYVFGENLKKLVSYKQQQESTDNYFKTVKDIAKDLNISYQSLLNYQDGKRIPSYSVLQNMVKYFNVKEIDLFSEKIKIDKNYIIKIPKENIDNAFFKSRNDILTDVALKNFLAYSKSKSDKDMTRLKTINTLLENPKMLDSLTELLNNK